MLAEIEVYNSSWSTDKRKPDPNLENCLMVYSLKGNHCKQSIDGAAMLYP